MSIPKTVTEREMWTAAKPLFDLLGVTPHHVYGSQPFPVIERGDDMSLHLRFQVAVDPDAEPLDWPQGVTGDGEFDEKTYEVDVVVVSAGDHHVIEDLWPGVRPAGTRVHESGV